MVCESDVWAGTSCQEEATVWGIRAGTPGVGRGGWAPHLVHYFEDFCFFMVEDLVNQPPFTCFAQWLRSRGFRWDGPLVPMLASPQQRLLARAAEGQQARALSGKAACPPLLPFGLSCEQHFEGSCPGHARAEVALGGLAPAFAAYSQMPSEQPLNSAI